MNSGYIPRVSVVMSVYNDAVNLDCAVRSVIGQTFRDLELIVVNDGSTDASGEILDQLSRSDERIRVVHQSNAGLTRALISACALSRGELVARQDSDDWSEPERLASQVRLLETDRRIGFASCTTRYVGPANECLTVVTRPADPLEATRVLLEARQGPPAHGSVMFRRAVYNAVGGYRGEFHFAQDADLWLRMAEHSLIGYVPGIQYVARRSANSTSGAHREVQRRFGVLAHECRGARLTGRSEAPFLDEARRLTESVRSAGVDPGTSSRGIVAQDYLIGSQLARNGDSRARSYLFRVLRSRPAHWRAWLRLMQSLAFGRKFPSGSDH